LLKTSYVTEPLILALLPKMVALAWSSPPTVIDLAETSVLIAVVAGTTTGGLETRGGIADTVVAGGS
jgi:hypothetical protein